MADHAILMHASTSSPSFPLIGLAKRPPATKPVTYVGTKLINFQHSANGSQTNIFDTDPFQMKH